MWIDTYYSIALNLLIRIGILLTRGVCLLISALLWLLAGTLSAEEAEDPWDRLAPDFNHRLQKRDGFADPNGWYC